MLKAAWALRQLLIFSAWWLQIEITNKVFNCVIEYEHEKQSSHIALCVAHQLYKRVRNFRTVCVDELGRRSRFGLKRFKVVFLSPEGFTPQPEWVTKRQHPGKRHGDELEKRQHPGRREEDEEDQYLDVQRRQHPGKREDEIHSFTELQKRQHPGKRSAGGYISDDPVILLSELSKRQHPGKRYLVLHSKRQHPGKRQPDDGDGDGDWDAGAEGDEDLAGLEKRQHPGKRFWDNSSPDLGTNSPCDVLDPTSCSKTSLLLDFLDNISKSHAEEKRQHPGKRFTPEQDLVKGE